MADVTPKVTVVIARSPSTRLMNQADAKNYLKGYDSIFHNYFIGLLAWKDTFKPIENPN